MVTPSELTKFDLYPDLIFAGGRDDPGLYYGDSRDFTDLVNFWNLRASRIQRAVLRPSLPRPSPRDDGRLPCRIARTTEKSQRMAKRVTIWNKSRDIQMDLAPFGTDLMRGFQPGLSHVFWNGLNIKPPLMGFEQQPVLGTISENGRISVTFELPPKPFFDDGALHTQNVVVSVRPLVTAENVVLKPPYFPKLNEYYGREAYFEYNAVRSSAKELGLHGSHPERPHGARPRRAHVGEEDFRGMRTAKT